MIAATLAWAKNRWVLGAAGLAAFALVIWLVGDAIVLGEWRPLEGALGQVCAVAIAAAAWLALELRRARAARRRNEALLSMLAGAGAEGDSAARAAHEIALLRQRFEEAAAVLRKARFKGVDGEQRYVQELPWYVIIGAPGSGKTTALVNSGLRFPLPRAGGDPALAGVGGTRNCDWWFTEEAVLLDTAGRYTTQESDVQADAAAWSGFLDLLKRFRPGQPLNGALVTLSISDLVLWGDAERARYAQHVRARVDELYQRLGVRFPLYLLVTKADLLAGFAEFFGELDAENRARVWGTTFDFATEAADGGKPGVRFAGEFVALENRLYAELGERLQQEPDLQRRAAIYRFPQEFHGTGSPIGSFLEAAFGGERAPLLRGVYFTSGTQEGSPIDRVLGGLARTFKLEHAASAVQEGSGKSFFLRQLLREVIFPESGLAGRDADLETKQRTQRALAFAAVAVVTIAVIAAWTSSFFGNLDWISAAEAKSKAAKAELQSLGAVRVGAEAKLLKAMRALRELPGAVPEREGGTPWLLGMGLYQGGKLGAQAQRAYRNGLRDLLLPHASMSLEDLLRGATGRDAIGGALDAYQAFYDDKKPNVEPAAVALAQAWRLEGTERAELAAHLRAGYEAWRAEMRPTRNDAIIRDARQRLAQSRTS